MKKSKIRKTVTVAWLKKQGACIEARRAVRAIWGSKRIPLTRKNLLRLAEQKNSTNSWFTWLAAGILSTNGFERYRQLRGWPNRYIWTQEGAQVLADVLEYYWKKQ